MLLLIGSCKYIETRNREKKLLICYSYGEIKRTIVGHVVQTSEKNISQYK